MTTETIRLSEIVFDGVIYPRKDHDPALVQRYADTIDQIEEAENFMSVTQDYKLLDGKHRWLAYRKNNPDNPDKEIEVIVYNLPSEHEQLAKAIELNSSHGWQLTTDDKKESAKSLYAYGMTYNEIAKNLHVGKTTITKWLSRTVKENKAKRDRKIKEMWLACYTQQEIADEVGLKNHADVSTLLKQYSDTETTKPAHLHQTKFKPPIYNVWKQQNKSNGVSHFGNSEATWLDNLLYLYTNPLDIVVDPFAGGGSTIDVCKLRGRRYWVGDRKPIIEREHEIRLHDITNGLPKVPRWKDTKLVYLDPPYWKQAERKYSDDPQDLANMSLDDFHNVMAKLIKDFAKKLTNAYIALIIQPTQWNAPQKQFTDHITELVSKIKLPLDMRYSVPYESQQYNAQMVNWSKENKTCLVLTREIIVWKAN